VLRRIAGESRRLRRIVDDLLWLARADSGAEGSAKGAVADVEAVAAACVERFEAVATRNHVALAFTSEGQGSGMVEAPAELVDRLAGVLIDNACKYAGAGGTVSVVAQATPTRVVLRVDDSGPGIPADQRAAVFDRFHRAAPDGHGAGLGLAIADSVVRLTGGTWSVGDAPLGGARMEVSWRSAHDGRSQTPDEHAAGVDHDSSLHTEASRRPGAHLGAT
jgi:signal transduction histidine kinase